MKKAIVLLVAAVALPTSVAFAKPGTAGTHGKSNPMVMYVLKGTLTSYTAATADQTGSITIDVQAFELPQLVEGPEPDLRHHHEDAHHLPERRDDAHRSGQGSPEVQGSAAPEGRHDPGGDVDDEREGTAHHRPGSPLALLGRPPGRNPWKRRTRRPRSGAWPLRRSSASASPSGARQGCRGRGRAGASGAWPPPGRARRR